MKLYLYTPHSEDFYLVANEEILNWMRNNRPKEWTEPPVDLQALSAKLMSELHTIFSAEDLSRLVKRFPTFKQTDEHYGVSLVAEDLQRWERDAITAFLKHELDWEIIERPYQDVIWSKWVGD